MKFKIDKNIPVPLKTRSDKPNLALILRGVMMKLEVGHSFTIPDKKYFNAFGNAKKYDTQIKIRQFTARREGKGYRIFRTA